MVRHSQPRRLPPTELTIYCEVDEGAAGLHIADIGRMMSQINRRTYRQGYQYAVAKIEFYADTGGAAIMRLPHSWPCVNAWVKGFSLWRKQQDDRLEESGLSQTVAANRDFKIYIDTTHADGGYAELQPITLDGGVGNHEYLTLGQAQVISPTVDMDWDKSQVVIPNKAAPGNTVEYYCHMIGPDNLGGTPSFGLIEAYAESRNRPMQIDPNIVDVASGGIYGEMFDVDEATGDIVTNAQNKNAALPYLNDIDSAIEFYPGGSVQASGLTLQDVVSIQAGNRTVASSTTGPFLANCGLIGFLTEGTIGIKITLVPGDYKGVMARPMQDVN